VTLLTETELKVVNTSDGGVLFSRRAAGKSSGWLNYSPDGRMLFCVENAQNASILDSRTREVLVPMPGWHHPIALSPDGRWLLLRVAGRRLQLWDFVELRRQYAHLGVDWKVE
jgi:hypothetical protein